MNAARYLAAKLPREAALRLLARPPNRFAARLARSEALVIGAAGIVDGRDAVNDVDELDLRRLEPAALAARLGARHAEDLASLLNACTRAELELLARAVGARALRDGSDAPSLRRDLWRWGAVREAGSDAFVGTAVQPEPVLLGGRLVVQASPRGAWPPARAWPRPEPPPAPPSPPAEEPETVEELLAAADRLVGVRLGPRDADKGAWGTRAAALLGVVERGGDEPDWRGDVEIKTVPVVRDPGGGWRIAEDPAVAMASDGPSAGPGSALAKLQRVLWLVRAATDDGDTAILSWYFLEWDAELERLVRRYLHQRPKGPAGTRQRGWYLHKRFFADAGLLATLNGSRPWDTHAGSHPRSLS